MNGMNRTELKQLIMENYSVEADYPWLTAALDGSVSDEQIKMLLDMSYVLTATKPRQR